VHASSPGSAGNIPAYDISEPCCAASVIAKNTIAFTGGQDERNFQTVAKSDIDTTASTLKTTLSASMQGALQGQLKPQEHLQLLPCAPIVSSDHQPGQEATRLTVTVSQTCSAVAYDGQEVAEKATQLLTTQAKQTLGTGYSLFGNVQVSVTQATVTNNSKPLVFLSFHAQGTWIYALSQQAQQRIKQLIAGKTKQEAMHILQSLPGTVQASISWDGFSDDTRLPKDTRDIHFHIIVQHS
jgi:VCBS repeat-containing protein